LVGISGYWFFRDPPELLEKLGFIFQRRATVGGLDTLFFELDCGVAYDRPFEAKGSRVDRE
jgi:hypothetical protein